MSLRIIANHCLQFFMRHAYRREMLAVLVLKVAALWLLWKFFMVHGGMVDLSAMVNQLIGG